MTRNHVKHYKIAMKNFKHPTSSLKQRSIYESLSDALAFEDEQVQVLKVGLYSPVMPF